MITVKFVDDKPQVTINGKQVEVFPHLEKGCVLVESPRNIEFEDLENIQLKTIPNEIFLLGLSISNGKEKESWLFDLIDIKKIDNNNFTLGLSGDIEPGKWNIKYFYPIFEKNLKELSTELDKTWCETDSINHYFNILVSVRSNWLSKTIKDILEICREKIDCIYEKSIQELAEEMLEENISPETITLKFNFPRHFKALCKQYLSYFDKFLLENGVSCELSLIDKNDITYMTIKVDESTININDLREALAAYFSLPVLAGDNIIFDSQNIKIQQLIANIEHLKSQLRLAKLTISQYENLPSSRPVEYVVIDSLEKESAIELYDGLIKVNKIIKLKFFGIDIEFNVPLLLDKIKNKL